MGYLRNFVLLLVLITSATCLAQGGGAPFVYLPITQGNPIQANGYFIHENSVSMESTHSTKEYTTPRRTDKSYIRKFREENSSSLIQPLSLLLTAISLIGLGIATRLK